jgi:glycosyltransferase involved in cell wall biosynthesis
VEGWKTQRSRDWNLAAAAVARFNTTSAKPSVLFVRGCAQEHEKKVRDLLHSHLSHDFIKIKPYTYLRERLDADMRKTALLLMPSRAEGFGLVALEAIGLGVPILISSRSGLADVLRSVVGSIADRFIVTVSEKSDLERDAAEWSSRIATVMADLDSANRDVQDLRLRLSTELLWSRAAEQLTEYIATAQQRTLLKAIADATAK